MRLTGPLILLVLALTAVPIDVRPFDWNAIGFRLEAADVIINILGYVPIGIVLAGSRPWCAIGVAALVSATAETSQVLTMGRFPSPLDLIANIIGAIIGVAVSRRETMVSPMIELGRRSGLTTAVLALMLFGLLLLPGSDASLANWDAQAQLAVGAELTGHSPWSGDLQELAIVSGALDPEVVKQLARERSFDTLSQAATFGPMQNLDLTRLRGRPLLTPSKLKVFHDRIVSAGAFTVLVRFRTRNTKQTGPARIVTYSLDSFQRNFTLAQNKHNIVFRVRTPVTGLNGLMPHLITPPIVVEGRTIFVAASFDGRFSRVFVDGTLAAQMNLKAADSRLLNIVAGFAPALVAGLGMLLAASIIGLGMPRRLSVLRMGSLTAGFTASMLLFTLGGEATLLLYQPWIPALSLAGSIVMAASLQPMKP